MLCRVQDVLVNGLALEDVLGIQWFEQGSQPPHISQANLSTVEFNQPFLLKCVERFCHGFSQQAAAVCQFLMGDGQQRRLFLLAHL